MSSRAIEAARAYVKITGEDSHLRKVLGGITGLVSRTASVAKAALKGIAAASGIGLLVTGVVAATQAVMGFSEAGAAIDDMTKRTGASAESLSQLKYAAEQSGSTIQDIEKGMRKLSDVTTEAARGGSAAAKSLARVGLTAADLEGLSPDQRFLAVAQALSQVTDPSERASLAMDLLGKSGAALLPLMEEGASGIQTMMAEADQLGLTLSGDQAAAAAQFDDAWAKITSTLGGAAKILGTAVLPVVTWLINAGLQAIPVVTTLAKAFGQLLVQGASKAWDALSQLRAQLRPLMDAVIETFSAIMDALQSGDVALAGRIFWLTLRKVWLTGIQALSHEWALWKKGFQDTFAEAMTFVLRKWHQTQNVLSKQITKLMSYFDSTINVEAVSAELDVMLTQQLRTVDAEAQANQKARDTQFEKDISGTNADLEQARAEWVAAVAQARDQAQQKANEPSAAAVASSKFDELITEMKSADIATRVDAAVRSSGASQDIRSVSGASQLTGLINRIGEVDRRTLAALDVIARNTQALAGIANPQVVNI